MMMHPHGHHHHNTHRGQTPRSTERNPFLVDHHHASGAMDLWLVIVTENVTTRSGLFVLVDWLDL